MTFQAKTSNIKCTVLNARSLLSWHKTDDGTTSNLERFQELVYTNDTDVVCVNETWLHNGILNSELLHDGYAIYRKDRDARRAGGVLIAVKTNSFRAVKQFTPILGTADMEIVSAELTTIFNQKILFCSCYRPPDSDRSWIDSFTAFLDQACDEFSNIVISGDFNLPHIPWESPDSASGVNELSFVDSLNDHFLSQLNNKATRGSNVLDLVITTVPDQISVTEVLSPDTAAVFTDHSIINYEYNAFVKGPIKSHRSVYDYRNGDFKGLRMALQAIDLSSNINHENINADWLAWKESFLATVSEYIPSKRLKGRSPVPWINGAIIYLIKKKDTVRQKLKKSPTNDHLKQRFTSLRAQVKRMIRDSRKQFFSSIEADMHTNPKRFWSILKTKSKSRSIPDRITMETTTNAQAVHDQARRCSADTPLGIANLFNSYFASVFSQSATLKTPKCTAPEPTTCQLMLAVGEVQTILESLDVTKATGPDGIPAKLLKETASVIAPSLCELFNKSLHTGTLPQEWKDANIVPVFKKGDPEHTENYRPISLLSQVSKVLERCVLNNLKGQLYIKINKCQHGFISGKSCTSNLLEVLDHIGSLLDNGEQVDVIYMDMSKAFDKVSHGRLLRKLREFGYGGNLLQWFSSYLTDRRQCVTVAGATSNSLPVGSGVPQGSILGPALFLLFVNDLPDAVESSDVAMFADDTKIYKKIKSLEDAASLQSDINHLDDWSTTSGLKFNEIKCKSQSITRKLKPVISTYNLKNTELVSVNAERDLGVWVSNNLTWNKQVLEQTARANRLLGFIRRNTRYIQSVSVRRTLYLTLVRAHFAYAAQLWAPQSIEMISRIERTQRRATKYILKLPFSSTVSYSSRLQTLSLLPITYWHEYLDMVFFFKMTHGLVHVKPNLLPVPRCTRPTRSSSSKAVKYTVRQCKTSTYQKSYLTRTTRIWNALADDLKLTMNRLNSFKRVMLSYYFVSLPNYNCNDPRTFKSVCLKCNSCRSLAFATSCC